MYMRMEKVGCKMGRFPFLLHVSDVGYDMDGLNKGGRSASLTNE